MQPCTITQINYGFLNIYWWKQSKKQNEKHTPVKKNLFLHIIVQLIFSLLKKDSKFENQQDIEDEKMFKGHYSKNYGLKFEWI